MLRRLHLEQPESFAFTPANEAWAKTQIAKYPEGRQASAIIPLLWRAQEQEGWLTRPAIEAVARMLDMAYIRALEVATFYFMFQLQPVGSVAHVQICGTLSCMICGAEDLMEVCKTKIAAQPHALSEDGRFSWEEVECLGACANAPMAQIGKDYYEDLTAESLSDLIDRLGAGEVPLPGPQNGRYAAEPAAGLTSLTEGAEDRDAHNASVALAVSIGDTIKRIDGTEVALNAPWMAAENPGKRQAETAQAQPPQEDTQPKPGAGAPVDEGGSTVEEAEATSAAKPVSADDPAEAPENAHEGHPEPAGGKDVAPEPQVPNDQAPAETAGGAGATAPGGRHSAPAGADAGQDDLKRLTGLGPRAEERLHELGVTRFAQIAAWDDAEIDRMDEQLSTRGRIRRDDWVGQAKTLASE
ncbi:NADH-quinone oxidoreductase subunit E [Pseudoroseicyclus aestuarii]|uniref:NADH dehydrogenase subunit E n=1 Tax=Pseudoroseicyclus aestuarii TaxID=1795041 RepID=A0A318SR48_9RHOB|nr:NADH-quinone oxidoreductase subunit E [Pseudoroseicyclus aestuarii]PYE84143.1 NADH dehydrogenase subunit E [Pseudoroseicyclus aestuarii]